MRVVKLLPVLMLISVCHAEVIYQTSFESVPEETEPQWVNSERVETSDPIFKGTDLSGVSGDWFVLIGNTSVQIPTEPGQTYRLSFKAAVTSPFSLPDWVKDIDLVNEAIACLGTRELQGHDGEICVVEDLAPLRSVSTPFQYAGGYTWRFYEWKPIEMEFVASSSITRLKFRLSNASDMRVGVDGILIERIAAAATRARIGRLETKQSRIQKALTRMQRSNGVRVKKLVLKKKLRKLRRELHKMRHLP